MKQFSKKGALLFAGAMAVCAFALPAAASASSWGPFNLHTTLHSPNLGFTSTLFAPTTSSCTQSSFTAKVTSAADLQITAGSLGGLCTFVSSLGPGTCTMTTAPTFPWTATAVTTSNIQIHRVNLGITFENRPGGTECRAPFNGSTAAITGNLSGGNWTSNATATMDFNNSEGLLFHSSLGVNAPITTRGFLDATGALTVS